MQIHINVCIGLFLHNQMRTFEKIHVPEPIIPLSK